MNIKTTGVLVLAAGASSRLGQPKQFLVYEEDTLVHRAALAALEANCSPVVVVAGNEYRRIKNEFTHEDVTVLQHRDWPLGIGSSIKAGLAEALHQEPGLDAIILTVCDQLFVTSKILKTLIGMRNLTGKKIIASSYAGGFGVPVLFDRKLFPLLAELPNEKGAKHLLNELSQEVMGVSFPEGAIDIDTPADCRRHLASRGDRALLV